MRHAPSSHSQARRLGRWSATLAVAAVCTLVVASPATATKRHHHGPHASGHYVQRNLVSDVKGRAEITDPNLVNAWGLTFGPTTPAWVADNGADVSTLYSGANATTPAPSIVPLVVSIPGGAPTGAVFNGDPNAFVLHAGTSSGAARFLFSSEAGAITGWNPNVPSANSTAAQTVASIPDAIFKGLAIANTATGQRLYATDFHHGTVDVWDQGFTQIMRPGAFHDPAIPQGYAPFGIQTVNGDLVVTYAKQDAKAEDDAAGPGRGFVDVYDTNGTLLRRFAKRGPLNSPWGIALAPQGFGKASGALLIGNFGDGRINAYDPVSGRLLGPLRGTHGKRISIDGLWSLQFGNGVIGTPQTLLFTAGPDDEAHGLFGSLTAAR